MDLHVLQVAVKFQLYTLVNSVENYTPRLTLNFLKGLAFSFEPRLCSQIILVLYVEQCPHLLHDLFMIGIDPGQLIRG